MPTYVLIWIVLAHPNSQDPNSAQSVATHSQEFVGPTACEDAKGKLVASTHAFSLSLRDSKATEEMVRRAFSTETEVIAECFRKDSR